MSDLISLTYVAKKAFSLMDLTSLNENDTDAVIVSLCQQAKTPLGSPAAVCVYPQFIKTAKKALADLGLSAVKVATVTNFPHGNSDIQSAVAETIDAVKQGADEVDVVFPYRALIDGDKECGFELVQQCKKVCAQSNILLKVIIESGELKTADLIREASEIAIKAGADFIKTSTGKVLVNATLESAEIMLNVIKDMNVQNSVGFKAAGGVRSTQDAQNYLMLTAKILGEDWITADHFRFGASGLLNDLLKTLDIDSSVSQNSQY